MRQVIQTNKAPGAIGNYSQAIKFHQTLYVSGQIPLDPVTTSMVEGDIKAQVMRVLDNMKAILSAAGGAMNDVVKLTVYLTDLSAMPTVNDAIALYFKKPYPARTSIQVAALPKGALVEIDAIAVFSG